MNCRKGDASRSLARITLTALCLSAGGVALAVLPVIGVAHADHGQGGGHDKGDHDNSGHDADHSGPGRGGDTGHDNRGPGRHDDDPDHDAHDDRGGLAGGPGADDPAGHDAGDDHGQDGAVIPAATAN